MSGMDPAALQKLSARLAGARMRMLADSRFFGSLILQLRFAADTEVERVGTDGVRLYLNPAFVETLDDAALDFLLYHEVMHLALRHAVRGASIRSERLDEAADIIANANLMAALGMKEAPLIGGVRPEHLAPDGRDGTLFTLESLCALLGGGADDGDAGEADGMPADVDGAAAGGETEKQEAGKGKGKSQGKGKGQGEDQDEGTGSGSGQGNGQGSGSGNGDGQGEGSGDGKGKGRGSGKGQGRGQGKGKSQGQRGRIDSHDRWGQGDSEAFLHDRWVRAVRNAAVAARNDGGTGIGAEEAMLRRLLGELRPPQSDWRELLNNFVQEEITDYSFEPPDRRFDGDFFLPDFNQPSDTVRNLLFAVDTSGSIGDKALTAAFSEIKGAIDQFDGRLSGKLCFFESNVTEPIDFESIDELLRIRPHGGGGTNVAAVFALAAAFDPDELSSIVILTDGECRYPPESVANGVPVLWLINNETHTPPWGRLARISVG